MDSQPSSVALLQDLQDFPDDLWNHIFKDAGLPKLCLQELFPLRTVCKSWDRIICSFPKINCEGIPLTKTLRLPKIFGSLRSFHIYRPLWDPKEHLCLLTGLQTLKIDDPFCVPGANPLLLSVNLLEFQELTNLRKLVLSSNVVDSLGPLTFLQSLQLHHPFLIPKTELERLSHLTSLTSDIDIFRDWGYSGYGCKIGSYEGQYQDGKKHGYGIYGSGGRQYEGEFMNDKRHGYGTNTYPNGHKYQGLYRNDSREGPGVILFSNGDRFEGTFNNNKEEGLGFIFHANGDKFEGIYHHGKRNGPAKKEYALGGKFEGHYKDDQRHGPSVEYFASGGHLECDYNRGYRFGQGTEHYKNGNRFEGFYGRDGPGVLYFADGHRIEGKFLNKSFKIEGPGKIFYPNGNRFEGHFNGKKQGPGIMYFPSGDRYECTFVDDVPQRPGRYYYANGESRCESSADQIVFSIPNYSLDSKNFW